MSHAKRISAAKQWPIERKSLTFVTNCAPGPHRKAESLPLNVVLRDMLDLTKTTRESKKILNAQQVLIDGIVRKDHHLPIGFLDVISFKELKEEYMVLFDQTGKLSVKEIKGMSQKPHKIIGKTLLKKGKMQLNLYNGRNLLVDSGKFAVGDSVCVEKNKVTKHLKLEKGQQVFLIGGKHVGMQGKIEDVKDQGSFKGQLIVVKTENGLCETARDHAFVVGEKI